MELHVVTVKISSVGKQACLLICFDLLPYMIIQKPEDPLKQNLHKTLPQLKEELENKRQNVYF